MTILIPGNLYDLLRQCTWLAQTRQDITLYSYTVEKYLIIDVAANMSIVLENEWY